MKRKLLFAAAGLMSVILMACGTPDSGTDSSEDARKESDTEEDEWFHACGSGLRKKIG